VPESLKLNSILKKRSWLQSLKQPENSANISSSSNKIRSESHKQSSSKKSQSKKKKKSKDKNKQKKKDKKKKYTKKRDKHQTSGRLKISKLSLQYLGLEVMCRVDIQFTNFIQSPSKILCTTELLIQFKFRGVSERGCNFECTAHITKFCLCEIRVTVPNVFISIAVLHIYSYHIVVWLASVKLSM